MARLIPERHPDLFNYRTLTGEELDTFDRDGFLRLGRTLTDQGLERMRAEAMTAWEAEKGPFDPDATWLKNSLLSDIHHRSETVRRYYFHGPPVDIAGQIIGPNVKGATSQLTFKMRGNTMPFHWHQDNAYGELDPYTAVTCLTALDDAAVENGCLWLIPGSHRQGQADPQNPEEKAALLPIKLEADESRAVPVAMKAGEAICFHCWMLHKSEGNRSATHRRILFLRFADADAVEVYNGGVPRLGRLLRGTTRFAEVEAFEADLM